MTHNIGIIPGSSSLSRSISIKKMPVPSGITLEDNTQTYDYDEDSFFIRSNDSSLNPDYSEKKDIIDKLYKYINSSLKVVSVGNLMEWDRGFFENTEYMHIFTGLILLFPENSSYSLPFQSERRDENVSQEIIQFCDNFGIRHYLFLAIDLVKKHFPSFQDISITLEKDQEIDEEWVALDVTIEGEIEEVLDRYDKYTENLVYEIPWPERDRIRFSYNIV